MDANTRHVVNIVIGLALLLALASNTLFQSWQNGTVQFYVGSQHICGSPPHIHRGGTGLQINVNDTHWLLINCKQ